MQQQSLQQLNKAQLGEHMRHVAARGSFLSNALYGTTFVYSSSQPCTRHYVLASATAALHPASISRSSRSRSAGTTRAAATTAAVAVAKAAVASSKRAGGKSLMIVESPTKATKIQKFLGDDYKVLASYGHVRDLLNKPGAVDPAADFNLVWAMTGAAGEARLKEIASAASGCGSVLLATDPDREGEAISWHITQELKRRGVLQPGQDLQRVTFSEVTQKAVKEALQHPRQVSDDLVDAYLARRALDYLLGFNLSPLLWRRLGPAARSAGRVQSVALRLVCEREDAVQLFVPDEYWTIEADFALSSSSSSSSSSSNGSNGTAATLPAKLVEVDGQKLSQFSIKTQQQAQELEQRLWQQQQEQQQQQQQVWYTVKSVTKRPVRRNPPPPLVTSTLQQEAARRLGFSASKTMQVAQQLYEGANTGEGLITYMRTDGVSLSAEAVDALRGTITQLYGPDHLPAGGPRVYRSRAKNAQEAHEAIRPTDPSLLPGQVPSLTPDQANLYSLVWRRAMASQMEAAEMEQVSAEFVSPCGSLLLRCSGSSLASPGWLAAWAVWSKVPSAAAAEAAYTDDSTDAAAAAAGDGVTTDDDDILTVAGGGKAGKAALSQLLQQLQEGQQVLLAGVLPDQHFTKPPPRYTEATMVKTLEEAGVGRPSTYAPIIRKLLERGYVVKSGRTMVPTPLGRLLTAYLTIHFTEYVDVNFTAKVEEQLDEVSAGVLPWKELMREFWGPLERAMAAAQAVSSRQVYEQLEQRLQHLIFMQPQLPPSTAAGAAAAAQDLAQPSSAPDPRRCPVCGGQLVLKPSRGTGGFIGCSNYESLGCTFGRPLWPDLEEAASLSDEEEGLAAAAAAGSEGGALMGAVKVLGEQPRTGLPVLLKRGPFGLYVQLGEDPPLFTSRDDATSSSSSGSTASKGSSKAKNKLPKATLPCGFNWTNTTLDVALQLLELPRTLGEHPDDGEPVQTNSGRFGPYVVHRTLYAPLPKDRTPQDITFEEAVELLAAKAARLRAKGKDPYAEKPKKGAKKTASKKASSSSSSGRKRQTTSSEGSSKAGRITGYILFGREWRASIAATGASKYKNLPSAVAEAWREVPDEVKAVYSERAREMNASGTAAAAAAAGVKKTSASRTAATAVTGTRSSSRSSTRSLGGSAAAKDSSSSSSAVGGRRLSTAAGSSTTTTSSSSRSRSRPQRGLTGYQLFCQEQRPLLLAAEPALASKDVMSRLGAGWRALSEQQKAAYSSSSSSCDAGSSGDVSSISISSSSNGAGAEHQQPEQPPARRLRSARTSSSSSNGMAKDRGSQEDGSSSSSSNGDGEGLPGSPARRVVRRTRSPSPDQGVAVLSSV